MRTRKAIFLDRDGVLNRDSGYVHKIEDLRVIPGVANALAEIQKRGFLLIVVSNQSGVARGYYGLKDAMDFNAALRTSIKQESGAEIDDFYICPHHPNGVVAQYTRTCDCRKPGTRLIREATGTYGIDLSESFFVGDRDSDMECARRAGIKGLQLLIGHSRPHRHAFATAASLVDALPHLGLA